MRLLVKVALIASQS